MKACMFFGEVYKIPGQSDVVKIMFNYTKFAKMAPKDCPTIRPRNSKILYTNHPLLKSSFGYSPNKDKNGNVANNIRLELDDFVSDESANFKEKSLIPWDDTMVDLVWEHKAEWPHGARPPKNGELTKELVEARYSSGRLARTPDKASFGDYMQLKCSTVTKNEKTGQEADPYTAFLKLWGYKYEEHPDGTMKRPCLAKVLTERNATNYEGEDKNVILDRGMYAEGVFHFDKFYFSKDAWGVTIVTDDLVIGTREEVSSGGDGEAAEECPM